MPDEKITVDSGYIMSLEFENASDVRVYDVTSNNVLTEVTGTKNFTYSFPDGIYKVVINEFFWRPNGKQGMNVYRKEIRVGAAEEFAIISNAMIGGVGTSKGIRYMCKFPGCGYNTLNKVDYYHHSLEHGSLHVNPQIAKVKEAIESVNARQSKRADQKSAIATPESERKAPKRTKLSPEEAKALALESGKE